MLIKFLKTIFLISITFFISSCKPAKDDQRTTNQVCFTEIGKGALYGNGAEGIPQSNMVITNNTDWQNLMTQMNTVNNVTDSFNETDIDFDTYEVIAIFLEIKPNGWEVEITNITKDDTNIHVYKNEKEFLYQVITQPFHIVKIFKNNKTVVFH